MNITDEQIIRTHYHQRLELDNYIMFCIECKIAGPSNDFGWRCEPYKEALARVENFDNPIMSEDRLPNKAESAEIYQLEECDHLPSAWRDSNEIALCSVCVQPIVKSEEFGWVTVALADRYNLI